MPIRSLVALVAMAMSMVAAPAVAGDRAVIELFTSQGCSSCPPADRLMGELAKRDDLIVLSLPVDYWDFLGWKDTLADPAFSERQRAYAATRGDGRVYTPQVVVNGLDHAVGSVLQSIEDKVAETRRSLADRHVDVDFTQRGDTIVVAVSGLQSSDEKAATVWLVLFDRAIEVKIGRGENTGRTITYTNVVREMAPIGMWHGKSATFELPKSDLMRGGNDGCAVLVQVKGTGPILGAEMIDDWQFADN